MSCEYCDLKVGQSRELDSYRDKPFGDRQRLSVSIEHAVPYYVIRHGIVGNGYGSSKGVRIHFCPMCGRDLEVDE